jgi:predicted ATPase
MAVHQVLRPTGAVGRIEVVGARPLTPMVGREAELAQLSQAWTNAVQGRGGIVHIPGEAGIGKSRLVRALTEHVGGAHVWQCSSHHRSTALYPVIQWLERRLGLDRAQDRLAAIAEAGLDPQDIGPLLGVPLPDERSPIDARADTLRAIAAFLAAEAAIDPLLLVVEDLHWADPTTVELLSRIAFQIPSHAALCVATYRREFEPPWAATRTIDLGALSTQDERAMVAASGFDTDLSVADGVPLFVEELLKMIAAGGGTFGDRRDSTTTNVPPTLQGLLTQRLERLRAHRDVIDVAAVLGRDFEVEPVAALVPLGNALAELTAQDVIRPVEGSPGRFEFTHALLHEAAYTRLLRVRRRALHRRVAELLTSRLAEREPEIVAHHWRRAGEPARSIPYWLQAGEQAINRAAFLEAAEHLRGGLEALDRAGSGGGDRAEFLVRLAGTLQAGVGYGADGVDEAYAQARRLGVGQRVGVVGRGQWAFHLLRAEYDRAAEFADEQIELGLLDNGHCGLGMVHLYRGEFELARTHLTRAYEHYSGGFEGDWLFQVGGDSGVAALAYNSAVLYNLGELEESRERSDLSLELAERVGGPVTRAQAWGMRALLHLARAEPAEFARWTERTRQHSVFHNVGYWRALASLLHGALRARAGELEQGRADVDAALDAYLRSGSRLGLSRFYVLQAELRLASGELDGALAGLAAAEKHVAATGEHYSDVELHRFKGRLLSAAGDADGATAAFERAVAVAGEQRAVMLELRAATTLAEHNGSGLERIAELCARFPAELALDDLVKARAALEARTAA